jgi:hypothetical protein
MADLSTLAGRGTTIVCVTHSIAALESADHVVALRAGGTVAYEGPPTKGPAALDAANWSEAFRALTERRPYTGAHFRLPAHRVAPAVRRPRPLHTFCLLTLRQLELLAARGRKALAALVALPALGALIGTLVTSDGWRAGPDTGILSCLLAVIAALIGAALTYSDAVTEKPVLRRERRVGVSGFQVVASKFVVAVLCCMVLISILVACLAIFRPIGGTGALTAPPAISALWAALLLTAIASSAAGLVISAVSDGLERAVTLVTGLALLQVAFNGVLVDLDGALTWISVLVPARLGVAGQITFLGGDPSTADVLWKHNVGAFTLSMALLVVTTAIFVGLAGWLLERRLTHPPAKRRGG